jgi:hypothetical protein
MKANLPRADAGRAERTDEPPAPVIDIRDGRYSWCGGFQNLMLNFAVDERIAIARRIVNARLRASA